MNWRRKQSRGTPTGTEAGGGRAVGERVNGWAAGRVGGWAGGWLVGRVSGLVGERVRRVGRWKGGRLGMSRQVKGASTAVVLSL